MPLDALTFDVLLVSHAAMPWAVLARRLRKDRLPEAPPGGETTPGRVATVTALLGVPSPDTREPVVSTPPEDAASTGDEGRHGKKGKAPASRSETFRCAACGAPAPLAADVQPCAHCGKPVDPPRRIVEAYRLLAWSQATLVRAERAWKRAVFWGAPIWIVLFGVLDAAWSVAILFFFITRSGRSDFAATPRLASALTLLAGPSATLGWAIGLMLASNALKWPRVFPRVPRSAMRSLPREEASCSECGAPAAFDEGRLATHCVYCGAEQLRPALAGAAASEAREHTRKARVSIVEAYRAMVGRREALLWFIDLMAGLQVAFVVVTLLERIPYVGAILDALS